MNSKALRWFGIITIIAITIIARLSHAHIYNATPVGALFLFAGAFMGRKQGLFLLPVAAMLLTDSIIGFYPGFIYTYLGFLGVYCVGLFLRRQQKAYQVGLASLIGSVVFFLLSNFGTWASMNLYPHTLSGLITCMNAGIPFYRYTLLGDLSFAAIFFGGYYLVSNYVLSARKA